MFRQILPVFLLLFFVCCQLWEQKCVAQTVLTPGNGNENLISEFLKPDGHTKIDFKHDKSKDETCEINIKRIDSVYPVAANGVIVALAHASDKEKKENDTKVNFVAKFIETKGEDWNKTTFKNSGSKWKTQLLTEKPTTLKSKDKVKSSAVVVKGSKIYYLFVTNSTVENGVFSQEATGSSKWRVAVIVGEITSGDLQSAAIKWTTLESNKLTKVEELNKNLKATPDKIFSTVGFGFSNGEKIVFAIQGEGEESNANKNVIAFFTLDTTQNILEFLDVKSTEKCFFSLFLWKEEIVMTPTVCEPGDKSNQKMKVFDYKNKPFNNSERPIFRLQEFLRDKKNFVTTTIDTETEVLLFTQQDKEHKIYLWVTDGSRIAKVDTIITESKENFDLSILHTKNDLFVLYNNYGTAAGSSGNNEKSTYNLKRLPGQLEKIKLILGAWKNTDNEIKKFFKNTDTAETLLFKDKLVGFLSGNGEDNNYWKDEYFYENATVTSGTKTSGGFTFNGAKAGAKWPVKQENKDQPYNFAAFGFTLVATVKIDHDTNDKWNSILGVGLEGSDKISFGLWCNNKKWGVNDGKSNIETPSTTENCVKDGIYRVVLTMEGNEISLYIDGKLVKKLPKNPTDVQKEKITHFYFGADSDTVQSQTTTVVSHVTITNVLLYNRPFSNDEIKNIKEIVKPVTETKKPNENRGTDLQEGGGNTADSGTDPQPPPTQLPLSTTGEEKKDETTSPSRTEDGGVGGGVRVFSLLLAVLCVSAPLLHL